LSELAGHIKHLMHDAGISSVNELSRRTGITLSVLQAIVNGVSTPRPSTLRTLSEFFGVSTKALISDLSGRDIGIKSFQSTSEVLKYLIEDVCVSERELERLTGVSQQLINNIVHGHTKSPRDATLVPLADFFDVTLRQLRAEEPLNRYREKGSSNEILAEKNKVKIIQWDFLKLLPDSLDFDGKDHTFSKFSGRGIYATRVQESCLMEPYIRIKDLLVIDYLAEFEKNRSFLVQIDNGEIVIGDYFKDRNQEALIFSNSATQQLELVRGNYRKLGMVLEVRKND